MIRQIVEKLDGTVYSLQDKRNELEAKLEDPKIIGDQPVFDELTLSLEHVRGQLYEARYILDMVWEEIAKGK